MDYTCYQCTKPFITKNKPSNPERPFCSLSCSAKYQYLAGRMNIPKHMKPTYTCTTCEALFQGNPSRKDRPFCSQSCAAKYNNTHKVKKPYNICICGKPARNTYCSNKCQGIHKNQKHVEQWLSTGTLKDSRVVKSYILSEQNGRCAMPSCPVSNTWLEQPIVLILDHINGDASDNRRSNLRLVCPNCDSQLPTFKSRNKGKGRQSRRTRYVEGKSF